MQAVKQQLRDEKAANSELRRHLEATEKLLKKRNVLVNELQEELMDVAQELEHAENMARDAENELEQAKQVAEDAKRAEAERAAVEAKRAAAQRAVVPAFVQLPWRTARASIA